jgi:hypothetical protein
VLSYKINKKKVYRLCQKIRIYSIKLSKKARKRDDKKNPLYSCVDLIKRKFDCNVPKTKNYTDVTYIPTPHTESGF